MLAIEASVGMCEAGGGIDDVEANGKDDGCGI